ncbi:MAG: hypothetical protein JWQ48_2685 [Conexibacter sp.]|jgi:hypothetical protein|nr:hypothetical protein [Conexibacter sp.]
MGTDAIRPAGRQLPQEQWAPYFERLDARIEAGEELDVSIALIGDELGGPEAASLPLASITFEDADDEIAIAVGGRGQLYPAALWHYAEHPREVWVEEQRELPRLITIVSADGTRTLLTIAPAD